MSAVHKPSFLMLCARIFILTLLATGLSFAVALFAGIVGILLRNALGGQEVGIDQAYKHIALPIAAAVFVIALVTATVSETRVYRRQRQEAQRHLRAA